MSKYDPYHPNYKKLYPGIEERPEILAVLKKSDRKMEYIEVDLKVERFHLSIKQPVAGCFAMILVSNLVMILLSIRWWAARRDPRRGERPVMRANAVRQLPP